MSEGTFDSTEVRCHLSLSPTDHPLVSSLGLCSPTRPRNSLLYDLKLQVRRLDYLFIGWYGLLVPGTLVQGMVRTSRLAVDYGMRTESKTSQIQV